MFGYIKPLTPELKVKAAGGISTLQDAEDFIALGAFARTGRSHDDKIHNCFLQSFSVKLI